MSDGLTRVVGGVAESLCWSFRVNGRSDPSFEAASCPFGPFDRDRKRRLRRGETFQRLDRAGCPREYHGLVWRPTESVAELAPRKRDA